MQSDIDPPLPVDTPTRVPCGNLSGSWDGLQLGAGHGAHKGPIWLLPRVSPLTQQRSCPWTSVMLLYRRPSISCRIATYVQRAARPYRSRRSARDSGTMCRMIFGRYCKSKSNRLLHFTDGSVLRRYGPYNSKCCAATPTRSNNKKFSYR